MKKLAQMAKGRGKSKGAISVTKGIVIGEKRPRDEMPDISPSKKGKPAVNAKKKRPISSRVTTKVVPTSAAPGEGTLANPEAILRPNASIMENPSVAKKVIQGLILPANKEAVEKLDLDWAITRFFHSVIQVNACFEIKLILLHF